MKINMGLIDRGIRIFLSIMLVDLYFKYTVSSIVGIILLLIAVVLLLTTIIGFCPVYHFLKLSTKKRHSITSSIK